MIYSFNLNPRWHGRAYKGATRDLRAHKRAEAKTRNAKTPHGRTKVHRLGRCGVQH